jgi:hypothetical protein
MGLAEPDAARPREAKEKRSIIPRSSPKRTEPRITSLVIFNIEANDRCQQGKS